MPMRWGIVNKWGGPFGQVAAQSGGTVDWLGNVLAVDGLPLTETVTGTNVTIGFDESANVAITGDWDFSGGTLRLPQGTTDPTSGMQEGDIFWDTDDDELNVYNGASWTAIVGGGGSVAGSDTEIQFNSSGSHGASSSLTWSSGTLSVSGTIALTGNQTLTTAAQAGTPGLGGSLISSSSVQFNDTNTLASTTAAAHAFIGIGIPDLTATNINVTTTDAANLYIAGAPTAGANQTITNSWSLWVDSGNIRLDGEIHSGAADGTTAHILDTTGSFTSGNLLDLQNQTASKFSVDFAGDATFNGVLTSANTISLKPSGSATSVQVLVSASGPLIQPSDNGDLTIDADPVAIGSNPTTGYNLLFNKVNSSNVSINSIYNMHLQIFAADRTNDNAARNLILKAAAAYASASTNLDGGLVTITGGGGASGSAGAANGGDVTIDGGVGYGTGKNGNVLIGGTNPGMLSMGDGALILRDVNAGITAAFPGGQGDGALTAEINEVSTVGTANDAVTLPAAVAGLKIIIINNGANTLEVWPASGDNAGAGVDTAVTISAGGINTYVAYDATNWEITSTA